MFGPNVAEQTPPPVPTQPPPEEEELVDLGCCQNKTKEPLLESISTGMFGQQIPPSVPSWHWYFLGKKMFRNFLIFTNPIGFVGTIVPTSCVSGCVTQSPPSKEYV